MVTIQKNLFIWVCSGRYLSGSKQISIPTLNNYVTLNISCQEIEKEKLDIRDQIHQEINSLIDARKQVGRNRLLNNWMWFFFFFVFYELDSTRKRTFGSNKSVCLLTELFSYWDMITRIYKRAVRTWLS
jgi:hypothetical protein